MTTWIETCWRARWRDSLRVIARLVLPSLLVAAGSVGAQDPQQTPPTPKDPSDRRIAVVIGNARYPSIPLNNPERDARVVAATLRKLGFDVSEHVNLPVKKFRQVLRDYVRQLQNESGVGLLFYAGHGVQIDGRNYLLPVDINLRDEEEIKDEAVDIDDLFMSKLVRAKTRGLIIILDACRDNPFRGKTRNIQASGGLAEMGAPGAYIAYSAAPGATAEDGPAGTNSVFTRHLAKEMLQPGVEIEAVFKNVRLKVLEETNRRQMPWTNSSLTIDFHFNPLVADARLDASKQADLARLQAMLEKSEAEQRKLGEQLDAARRELEKRGQSGERPSTPDSVIPAVAKPTGVPAAPPAAPPTQAAAPGGVPRAMPIEIRRIDAQIEPALARTEPAAKERTETAAVPPRIENGTSPGADSAPPVRADPPPQRTEDLASPRPAGGAPPHAEVSPAAGNGAAGKPPREAAKAPPAKATPQPAAEPPPAKATPRPAAESPPAKATPRPGAEPPPAKAAPRPGAEPPPAKAAPRPAEPPPAQIAQRPAAPARAGRAESERCVELQVRASLGEPVSTAELQKECRK
jgi:hypothetical protein